MRSPSRIVVGLLGIALLLGAATGPVRADDAAPRSEKAISPWFVYQDETDIEKLKPFSGMLSSISVCGDAPLEFVQACRALDFEVYKLVGGKPEAFDSAPHREETIRQYLELCTRRGYDGIDLDFEGLDASFLPAYSALMREASAELHRAGKKLSICVSYLMSTRKTSEETHLEDFYDPRVIGETCDVVRVMCYDMYSLSGGAAGPVSTQPWARDAMKYWLQFVPRERLIMGLPAYSGDFEMALNGKKERHYAAPVPVVPEDTAVQRVWLPYEQVNSYLYEGDGGRMHVFYVSDAASTRAHLETADRLGIGCIGFWHFAAVTPQMWEAVREWYAREPANAAPSKWLVVP